jgi:hypothetical protein
MKWDRYQSGTGACACGLYREGRQDPHCPGPRIRLRLIVMHGTWPAGDRSHCCHVLAEGRTPTETDHSLITGGWQELMDLVFAGALGANQALIPRTVQCCPVGALVPSPLTPISAPGSSAEARLELPRGPPRGAGGLAARCGPPTSYPEGQDINLGGSAAPFAPPS